MRKHAKNLAMTFVFGVVSIVGTAHKFESIIPTLYATSACMAIMTLLFILADIRDAVWKDKAKEEEYDGN